MASISATILKHHKKQNGLWNVKIRISQKGKSVYVDTSIVAKREDLDTKLRLKKVFIDKYLSVELNRLRESLNLLGIRADSMSAEQIRKILTQNGEVMEVFSFFEDYCAKYKGSLSTIIRRRSSIARLQEFVGNSELSPLDIKTKFLTDFQDFLKKPLRKDTVGRGGRSNRTIVNIIGDVQKIFNLMRDRYNDEDSGEIRIPNDPFRKFIRVVPKKSINKNLSIDQLKSIRDLELTVETDVISRDLFMLSFYLCGINSVDLMHNLTSSNIDRLNYNRSKTSGRRSDEAFISIKIPNEARDLIVRYAGYLQRRYKSVKSLNNRLSDSFNEMGKLLQIENLTFYSARHSFATLARNECRFSKDDVAAALNHSSSTITDIYIAKDWSIIDDVQEGVLSLLR
ncbi:tyrosine-type recombinase/integrase [Sphingobacterium psychroaquaticum]|uniref:Site-specific recombinase XerD n=1 Tax=Sphingobacterium psychroaquaticum TaxID=561061 RepID=A0A1X7JTF2_9SPHI|nr:phage integrase SAM-like domain-containing protein [Sphingobacterium psychroaquaticum]SMG31676.1 Site-specific recombinase XerD [Sphingobacterium psychroaquaticum]